MKLDLPRASEAQCNYIEILCNDIGLGSREQRNAYISDFINRDIYYLDELTKTEAHKLIEYLKEIKKS